MMKIKGTFPGGSVVKNLPANAGNTRDVGLIPGSRRPVEKEMITFTTASKRINYLGINLPKEAKKRGEKQRRKGKI